MRGIHLALAAACMAAFLTPLTSSAQTSRTVRTPAPAVVQFEQHPTTHFRARTSAERISAARARGMNLRAEQMGSTFSLTPRRPYIEGRGLMYLWRASLDSSFDTTGSLTFERQTEAHLGFRLFGMNGQRVVVDCAIAAPNGIKIRVGMHSGATYSAEFTPSAGRLFFLSPPIPDSAVINIDANQPSNGPNWAGGWEMTGCEFTPLSV